MKNAIKILSYTLAIILGFGIFSLAADNDMNAYSFLAFLLIEAQCIMTLIYINDK